MTDEPSKGLYQKSAQSAFMVVTHGGHYRFAESLVAAESKQHEVTFSGLEAGACRWTLGLADANRRRA